MSTSPLKREDAGKSEVAELRWRIELECQAAYYALHAPNVTATHVFINVSY
jgi:hypothetical protein